MAEVRGQVDAGLAAQVAQVRTVADVAARWPIAGVVIQDEFTHDVIAELPGHFLVFDSG